MKINIIVAHSKNNGIGLNNQIPWHYKCDMKWFKKITSKTNTLWKNPAILMGKNTWLSLPKRPLPNRINYVLSTTLESPYSFTNINDVLQDCRERNVDVLWIIGGSQVYDTFINSNMVDYQYITIIDKEYECDRYFTPKYNDLDWKLIESYRENEKNTDLLFNVYKNLKV